MLCETPDDESLVARATAGDVAAFESLIRRYEKPVFRMIWQMTTHRQTTEDLAQETFVKAFRSLDRFDSGRGSFSTWLYTIARNLCRNAHRKVVQFPVLKLRDEEFSDEGTPGENAERREDFQRLDEALNQLEEPFRTSFILAVVEEFPLAEVAAIEGVAVGTVKSRVSRAKEHLRTFLKSSTPID